MYTLLSGLYNHLTRKEEYYVLIIGLDNAGKTVSWWKEHLKLHLIKFKHSSRHY